MVITMITIIWKRTDASSEGEKMARSGHRDGIAHTVNRLMDNQFTAGVEIGVSP